MHDVHICRPSKTLKTISAALMVTTILSTAYAYRQRVWADDLHKRLVEVNLDDVKLLNVMTREQKESVCKRFRERGENRIANWIVSH